MYRRSKFNEILLEIRKEMSGEADHDVDLFAEMVRSGSTTVTQKDRKTMRTSGNSPQPEVVNPPGRLRQADPELSPPGAKPCRYNAFLI